MTVRVHDKEIDELLQTSSLFKTVAPIAVMAVLVSVIISMIV